MPDPAQNTGRDGFPASGWTPPGGAPAPGAAPAVPAVAQALQEAALKPVPTVTYLSGRPRTELYDLVEPVAVDGVEIRQVVLQRLSTGQISDFVDLVRSSSDGADKRFPLFYRTDGALLTDDEWRALDPDDSDALSQKAESFLPVRYRTAKTSDASSPPASDTSGSSSGASPTAA